jgi:hypothetical protein
VGAAKSIPGKLFAKENGCLAHILKMQVQQLKNSTAI